MAKEYQKPADPISEPGQSAMGASVIDYGEGRSDGLGADYCEPGSEGATVLKQQIANGGIGSHGTYEEGSSDGITGS